MKYKRLSFIANRINKDERVLDVGTDHALLPIFLVKDGITNNVVASDVNQDPLNIAIDNIKSEGLEDIISTKLMNGIEDIKDNEFDTIVIAGMGGLTISSIIKAREFNGRYIIHSTTNHEELRVALKDIGYKIIDEWVVFERKIHNIIVEAVPGEMSLTDKEIFMGPKLIEKEDDEVINYYKHIFDVFERNSMLSKDEQLKLNERNWIKEKLWNE